jgi:hypothetical protein
MLGLVAFLRCVGKAAVKNGGKALASLIPGGEAAFEIARDAWEEYFRVRMERPLPARPAGEEGQRLEGEPAGVGEREPAILATDLLHLPGKPAGVGERASRSDRATLRGPQRAYTLQRLLAAGDVADVHLACAPGDTAIEASARFIVKVAQQTEGNLVLENERRTVTDLCARAANTTHRPYLPTLTESFRMDGPRGKRVNVFRHELGFWTLEQVHQQHPALDGRHLAWIFKRLLTALGFCHRQGRIHGGVLPGHVLIHAGNHGLQLIGWGQSVAVGRVVKNTAMSWRDWYPTEIRQKQPATVATDLFLAAQCMVYLAGGDPLSGRMPDAVPAAMRRFMATCLFPSVAMRPDDAWKLMDEFDELLRKLYGPPMFHSLTMN